MNTLFLYFAIVRGAQFYNKECAFRYESRKCERFCYENKTNKCRENCVGGTADGCLRKCMDEHAYCVSGYFLT